MSERELVDDIREASQRLLLVLADPHPGLFSWIQLWWNKRQALERAMTALNEHYNAITTTTQAEPLLLTLAPPTIIESSP